jgi:hypothetical protein
METDTKVFAPQMEHVPLYLTRDSKVRIHAWVTSITDMLRKKCRISKWDYKNVSSLTTTSDEANWHHRILQQPVQGVIIIIDVA